MRGFWVPPQRVAPGLRRVLGMLAAALFLNSVAHKGPCASEEKRPATESSPRTVTLMGQGLPLSEVLAQIERQTGIQVHDRRPAAAQPRLDLHWEKVPFWQALDSVAQKLGAGVALYQADGLPALVTPGPHLWRVSYAGIFRSRVQRLELRRELDSGRHHGRVAVEIAWEPGWHPLFLSIKDYEGVFSPDPAGQQHRFQQRGGEAQEVSGRLAAELELAIPAPPRGVSSLAELRGRFALTAFARLLPVRFQLAAAAQGQAQTQTPEPGIQVTLRKLEILDNDHWEAEIALAYPGDPHLTFESYQDWLIYNRIYLERSRAGKKERFIPEPAAQRISLRQYPRAVIRYDFLAGPGRPALGQPADWTLVYETPSRFLQILGTFSFRDLPLP
jgi:hypothetical protein